MLFVLSSFSIGPTGSHVFHLLFHPPFLRFIEIVDNVCRKCDDSVIATLNLTVISLILVFQGFGGTLSPLPPL